MLSVQKSTETKQSFDGIFEFLRGFQLKKTSVNVIFLIAYCCKYLSSGPTRGRR